MKPSMTQTQNEQNGASGGWKKSILRSGTVFTDIFGISRTWSLVASAFILAVLAFAVWWFIHLAPPSKIVMATGPEGSGFANIGNKYVKNINGDPKQPEPRKHAVTLELRPSLGSQDNLELLRNPASKVDVGFVLSKVGLINIPSGTVIDPAVKQKAEEDAAKDEKLVSLGCIAYQPIFIFYRADAPVGLLSDFSGKHISIGEVGSGTNELATTLLDASGISAKTANITTERSADAAKALQAGQTDVVFLMGESAPTDTLRALLRAPGIRLFSFTQADAFIRKFTGLNKLKMPQGGIDLAKNIPAQDVVLLSPNIQLIAKKTLNPALSDLVLEAAKTIHGNPTLLQNKGEFPAPIEHNFKVSDDATRYYKSGKSFFYRNFPFWLATFLDQLVVVFVPTMIVLVSGLRGLYSAYKFQVQFRINRWYRMLLKVERERFAGLTPEKKRTVFAELEFIEQNVRRMKVPGPFVSQFYGLCGHIEYVRSLLENHAKKPEEKAPVPAA